jgi:hypothetical protein
MLSFKLIFGAISAIRLFPNETTAYALFSRQGDAAAIWARAQNTKVLFFKIKYPLTY